MIVIFLAVMSVAGIFTLWIWKNIPSPIGQMLENNRKYIFIKKLSEVEEKKMNAENTEKLRVKKLNQDVRIPEKSHAGDACFDFFQPENDAVPARAVGYKVPLGIAVEVPEGFYLEILLRSSTGLKTPLRLSNSCGVVDAGYRGEICLILDNLSDSPVFIDKGSRLSQGMLKQIVPTEISETRELSSSDRGAGGFGSTGK